VGGSCCWLLVLALLLLLLLLLLLILILCSAEAQCSALCSLRRLWSCVLRCKCE
jgi:hypothetical protein